MKNIATITLFVFFFMGAMAQPVSLNYYLPENTRLNPDIPSPESFLGYQVGEWHVTHDQLVSYMKLIAEKSDRAIIEEYARSYENRPLLHLIFTSPENQKNLPELKKEHHNLCNPTESSDLNISDMPVVIVLGYSIHGNEASGANASILMAYYLAAAQSPEMDEMLKNSIILVDPSLNPDGLTRFTTWANMHKSQQISPDPNNRAFYEVWPGGRSNHYWFDMNRDYLLLTNPESKGRVEKLQEWRPNIVTDHHEMGSNSTFFFQPGIPSRNNPLTPEMNYTLTKRIASFHAKALDKIGSYYVSEENFDDYYFGKGSSYPDINAGIGILFEQASVRGFERETANGLLTFPFAIKNQFTVSLSTLKAARVLKDDLLNYQKDFFKTGHEEAGKLKEKAYVFGDRFDRGKNYEFIKLLQGHHIEIHKLSKDYQTEDLSFSPQDSWVVPLDQENFRLIRSLFETVSYFRDSTFYDVSTWNLPMSFNMPYTSISNKSLIGTQIDKVEFQAGKIISDEDVYAWVFKWDDYYAPRSLFRLLNNGIIAKVATAEFTYNDMEKTEKFGYGTILIPVNHQKMNPDEIKDLIRKCSIEDGIDFYGLKTGWNTTGIDLGSSKFVNLTSPKILMFIAGSVSSRDAGEIWHLFDTRYKVPITMAEVTRLGRINLSKYNTIILPGGSYSEFNEKDANKLREWIKKGGNLIGYKSANRWLSNQKLIHIKYKKSVKPDTSLKVNYVSKSKEYSKQYINGAIFEVELDLTHPLAYGYHKALVPVFKNSTTTVKFPENSTYKWFNYSSNPLLSGYASEENIKQIAGSPFLLINSLGAGKIISIFDNSNFRGVWYGTNKIFCNAVLFGPVINSGRRRY
jgi:hypothetical protein